MIALYLLAAHLFGDFILQTRGQALNKFDHWKARTSHVLTYSLPFVPIAIWDTSSSWRAAAFIAGLFAMHWLTDTRRVRSTLGDVIAWQFMRLTFPGEAQAIWIKSLYDIGDPELETRRRLVKARNINGRTLWMPPPNGWTPLPIMIDQTLHICQLALLGGLLLR